MVNSWVKRKNEKMFGPTTVSYSLPLSLSLSLSLSLPLPRARRESSLPLAPHRPPGPSVYDLKRLLTKERRGEERRGEERKPLEDNRARLHTRALKALPKTFQARFLRRPHTRLLIRFGVAVAVTVAVDVDVAVAVAVDVVVVVVVVTAVGSAAEAPCTSRLPRQE
jgi:hypothetical protein